MTTPMRKHQEAYFDEDTFMIVGEVKGFIPEWDWIESIIQGKPVPLSEERKSYLNSITPKPKYD